MMMTLTPERKERHDLLNVISSNQALVYLKRKGVEQAIEDSQTEIRTAFKADKINEEIFKQLWTLIDNTFEEFV